VTSGATIVSNVAIVKLNATSPPAINVYKLADVPLGTVPANIKPDAISGLFLKNPNAIINVTPTINVHFKPNPIKANLGLLIVLIICSVFNDIPINKKINPKKSPVNPCNDIK